MPPVTSAVEGVSLVFTICLACIVACPVSLVLIPIVSGRRISSLVVGFTLCDCGLCYYRNFLEYRHVHLQYGVAHVTVVILLLGSFALSLPVGMDVYMTRSVQKWDAFLRWARPTVRVYEDPLIVNISVHSIEEGFAHVWIVSMPNVVIKSHYRVSPRILLE